jgi:hypothetical protein
LFLAQLSKRREKKESLYEEATRKEGTYILRTHQRMSIESLSKDAEGIRTHNTLRLNSRLEPAHLEIYNRLGLSGNPLGRRLMSRKTSSENPRSYVPPPERFSFYYGEVGFVLNFVQSNIVKELCGSLMWVLRQIRPSS